MTATAYFDGLSACAAAVIATDFRGDVCPVDEALATCMELVKRARVVHLIGNGGSAAIVAHAQNDLVKGAKVRALVHQDLPLLTACANDDGYAQNYARPLAAWMSPNDVLIVVSSSGQSENVLRAVDVAMECGATVLTCSGFDSMNPLRGFGRVNFYVPSSNYGYVELTHAALLHCLTDQVADA